jgi:hypothetical protein
VFGLAFKATQLQVLSIGQNVSTHQFDIAFVAVIVVPVDKHVETHGLVARTKDVDPG